MRKRGGYLKGKAGTHSMWCGQEAGAIETLRRRSGISSVLARKMCKNLSVPVPGKEE
jgi:hypothetical protein